MLFQVFRIFLVSLGAVGVVIAAALFVLPLPELRTEETGAISTPNSFEAVEEDVLALDESTTTDPVTLHPPSGPEVHKEASSALPASSAPTEEIVVVAVEEPRVPELYPFPTYDPKELDDKARGALVNIFCTAGSHNLKPITASGMLIDDRGVIVTNAHVAQYVLLAQSGRVNLDCSIRSGAPAQARWKAEVLYIPPSWITENAEDITKARATGTGEKDYALLRITSSVDGSPLPTSFPALLPDVRTDPNVFQGPLLIASYPAEFIQGSATLSSLYPLSSFSTVQEFFTFKGGTLDLISVGGPPSAQSGSSGGGVINVWGRIIGIITTTTEAKQTSERDLHALTLEYIDRDMRSESGLSLSEYLSGDLAARAKSFNTEESPILIEELIDKLSN